MNLPNYARFPGFHIPHISRKTVDFTEVEEAQEKKELTEHDALRRLDKIVWRMGVGIITLLIEILALQFYYIKGVNERFDQTEEKLNTILQQQQQQQMQIVPAPQEMESYEWYSPDLCQPHEYPAPEENSDYASI